MTVTFEITKSKTIITAIGRNGSVEKIDITGTEVEKDFTLLLKKLHEEKIVKQVERAIDINSWTEV